MPDGDPAIAGRRIRLFLSHHSPDLRTQERLDSIAKQLKSAKVDVIYDKEQIEDGRRWRQVINAMLAACDAAALLLTPKALDSPWVLKEATILRWRRDGDHRFPLLPVLLDDLAVNTLQEDNRWDPVELAADQAIAGDADAVASAIAKAIAPRAATLKPTPLERLAARISKRLRPYDEGELQAVVDYLGVVVPTDVVDQPHRLAQAIAWWMLGQPPPALADMAEALRQLGDDLNSDDAVAILDLVAPLWIELDAVSSFTSSGWRYPDRRDLAIGCAQPAETVKQYVTRAYEPVKPPALLRLLGVSAGNEEQDVRDELCRELGPKLKRIYKREVGDDEIQAFLDSLEDTRIFALLPLPAYPSLVATLQHSYKRLTFVFFASPVDAAEATLPEGVRRVEPALAPTVEDDVMKDYRNAIGKFLE